MNTIQKITQNCENDCQIKDEGSVTTLVAWSPTYDKNGNYTSKNPNTITSNFRCLTCGKRWVHNFNAAHNVDKITEIRL